MSVDELCRSYLDLKYHFDPGGGERGGAGVAGRPAGPVRRPTVRAHVAALRSVAGRGRRARGGRPAGRDRPDRAARRDPGRHLPAGARATPRAESGVLGQSPVPGSVRRALPHRRGGGRAGARGARAAPRGPRVSRRGAGHAGRAALGIRGLRARHARRRRRADRAAGGHDGRGGAGPPGRAQRGGGRGPRGAQALRHGAPRRDRAQRRSACVRHRRGAVRAAAPLRARRRVRRARALAVRAPSPGGDHGAARGPGRGAEPAALARGGGRAPERRAADRRDSRDYRRELGRARAFVAERDLVAIPDAPVDVVPTPSFLAALVPFAAYEPPPIYLGAPRGRFYVTPPDPSLPARRRRSSGAGTAATASRRWWCTRRIRGTTSSS